MLEIKNTAIEMKNIFDGFISRLGKADERISGLRVCEQKLPKLKSKEEEKS